MDRNFSIGRLIDFLDRGKGSLMGGSGAHSLSGRAARSGVWIGGGFVVQRGLQFVSNLILTRLLFPEAFGLMALCTVFIVGLAMFSDLGLKPAIIRDPRGNEPDFLNTAWTIQIIRGFVLFVCGCLLAYPISIIYDQAILFPLLAVLSISAAIAGFSSIELITAERDLDFRAVTVIQIAGQIVQILTMVALAYYWRSVWALAVGAIVHSAANLLIGHLLFRNHRHRMDIHPESAKSLVHFGKWIFVSTIVTFMGGEGLRTIQGGYITPAELGVLSIAYMMAAIPTDLALRLTNAIALPAVAEVNRLDPGATQLSLHKFRTRTLAISMVLFGFFVLFAQDLVKLLYDQRYQMAGTYFGALALANWFALIASGYTNAIMAIGESKSYLIISIISTITKIIATVIGLECFGIFGMIVALTIANLLSLLITCIYAKHFNILDFKLDVYSILFAFILYFMVVFI